MSKLLLSKRRLLAAGVMLPVVPTITAVTTVILIHWLLGR